MFNSPTLRRKWPIVVAVLALAGLACTCSALGLGEDTAPGSTIAGVTSGTRVTISNNGQESVCYVYISLAADELWGDDLLGSATIGSGGSHGFSVQADTPYDMRADDCSDRNVAERRDVTVGQDQEMTWSVAAGQSGVAQITLINRGSTPVCYVKYSLSSEDGWGRDRLAKESIIESGGSVTFLIENEGEYDFRAEDCDLNTLNELFNEQISSGDDLDWQIGL